MLRRSKSISTGAAMFPELRGQALVAEHGSWNRSTPVGYQVVRLSLGKVGRETDRAS